MILPLEGRPFLILLRFLGAHLASRQTIHREVHQPEVIVRLQGFSYSQCSTTFGSNHVSGILHARRMQLGAPVA